MSGDSYKIVDQNAVYFLTFTVTEWIDIFTRKDYKIIIVDALNYCVEKKGIEIYGWVLMTNHLHLIARAQEGFCLSHIIRDFKKFTSKRLTERMRAIGESRRDWILDKLNFEARRTGRAENFKVWQDSNHAVCIESGNWLSQRLYYIHQNPVKQMIVQEPHEYLFSSAVDYSGGTCLVKINKV